MPVLLNLCFFAARDDFVGQAVLPAAGNRAGFERSARMPTAGKIACPTVHIRKALAIHTFPFAACRAVLHAKLNSLRAILACVGLFQQRL